ncbi:L domain-like protein [Gonapodya prolifera JEL478]|uniref:L domain-like protein n=1 Tax=Gonapodya prolifera (strain JEL478) TaxID=1344416 RepID=A0A139A6C9_GONPJ|nr:L domain-like protein [Gonapodya prolifera JEL478]|eukprot:KXS12209.1 L domain-like protein [Gonapodya prolifera JEL478]
MVPCSKIQVHLSLIPSANVPRTPKGSDRSFLSTNPLDGAEEKTGLPWDRPIQRDDTGIEARTMRQTMPTPGHIGRTKYASKGLPTLKPNAFFLLSLLALLSLPVRAQNQASDCAPFETLYDQSNKTYNWPKSRCCAFQSFVCTPDNSSDPTARVQQVYLYERGLSGPFPALDGLTSLTRMDLYSNNLNGSAPRFTNLPNLDWVDLRNNSFTGSLPSLSEVPKLKYLVLSQNLFTGSMFSALPPMLDYLDVSSNNLTGTLPDYSRYYNLTSIFLISLREPQTPALSLVPPGASPNHARRTSRRALSLEEAQSAAAGLC